MYKKLLNINLLIAGLLALQAYLLTVGFTRYGTHPDELGSRIMDMVGWSQWRPFNYYYPTTHQYLLKLLTIPIADLGHFKLGLFPAYDVRLFDLIGRVIAGIITVGCSLLSYLIGRAGGYDKKLSLCFLLLASSFPLLNNLGRYNTTDVPNLFWILLSILTTLRAVSRGSLKWIVIAGVCAGLAVGVKFLGALFVPGLWIALVLPCIKTRDYNGFVKKSAVWAGALFAGFIFSTPYALIEPGRLLSDVKFLADRVPAWSGTDQIIAAIGIPLQILSVLSPIVLGFCLCGLYRAISKWQMPLHVTLLVSAVVFYLFMFNNHFYPLRFVLPLYGVLLLMGGIGFAALVTSRKAIGSSGIRNAVIALFVVGILLQFRSTAAIAFNFYNETRYEAAQWLKQRVNGPETIAMPATVDTYFPVPLLRPEVIYDTDRPVLEANPPRTPSSVKYALTSSMWQSDKFGPAERFNKDILAHWQLEKTFEMKPFLGKVPDHTEFLCPTIRVYNPPR